MSVEWERADDGSLILSARARSTIKYVIAHNVRQGKRDSGASLERWLAREP